MLTWYNADGSVVEVQVRFVRTVVGWFNVYNVSTGAMVNMCPDRFESLIGKVDKHTSKGCQGISLNVAAEVFGVCTEDVAI